MNNQYNELILKDGKQYHYDPDYDCYYRVYSRDEYHRLSHWSKYNWLYVIAVLTAICYYVEFIH
jgi:hypothetical protein